MAKKFTALIALTSIFLLLGCNVPTPTVSETPIVTETPIVAETASVNDCYATYTLVRVVNNEHRNIEFEFPCGWNIQSSESAGDVIVTAPDDSASFVYPRPDFGLQESTELEGRTVSIGGINRDVIRYNITATNLIMEFVEMGTDLSENEYDLMLTHTGDEHLNELNHILDTFIYDGQPN